MKKLATYLRFVDDAELTMPQYRLLMHYARVGESWENMRTIAQKCNMSLSTVSVTRKWLLESGYIEWVRAKNGKNAIGVCLIHEQPCSTTEQERSTTEQPILGLPHIKRSTIERKISIPNEVVELSKFFTHVAGVIPNPGVWDDKWELPLTTMLERAGSMDKVKDQITRAVELARDNKSGKRYTIVSPQSVVNIVANLQDEESMVIEVKAI